MRGRGLKLDAGLVGDDRRFVAPHAGAWIETQVPKSSGAMLVVAPRAGAWIETSRVRLT